MFCHGLPTLQTQNLTYLISTRDDVELFVEKGITVDVLGSNKAVATMVNRLFLEIIEKNSYYGS